MPEAEAFSLHEIVGGAADSKFVATRGVLRPGRVELDRISYRAFDGDTSVLVTIPKIKSAASDRLVGATVEIRGVAGIELDESGAIIGCNQSFAKMLGYPAAELVLGQSYWDLATDLAEKEHLRALLADDGISNCNVTLRREDGGLLCLLANITPVVNPAGVFFETTALDVTQLRRNEAELQLASDNAMKLALNDSLTGLPNRRLFSERLEAALAPGNGQAAPLALLYLDLAGFKLVNDTFGHSTGDALLVEVASRIRAGIGETGEASRLAGDEFTVTIVHPAPRGQALKVAGNLLSLLAMPFRIGEHEIIIGGSIGIGIFPDDSTSPEVLLQQADTAMYAARRGARAAWSFSRPNWAHCCENAQVWSSS